MLPPTRQSRTGSDACGPASEQPCRKAVNAWVPVSIPSALISLSGRPVASRSSLVASAKVGDRWHSALLQLVRARSTMQRCPMPYWFPKEPVTA